MACILIGFLLGMQFGQVLTHFQHTANSDSTRRGVTGLTRAITENQIPVRHIIFRQTVQEVVGHALVQIDGCGIVILDVVQRNTVDTPGLTTSPSGVVAIALTGSTTNRSTSLSIEIEGMECRSIITDNVVSSLHIVVVCSLSILGIASNLGSPVQQRNVHEAVNDQTIVILCTDSAPSLNELVTLIVALHQLVSSQDTCALTLFRANQLITGDTGNGIQEA